MPHKVTSIHEMCSKIIKIVAVTVVQLVDG